MTDVTRAAWLLMLGKHYLFISQHEIMVLRFILFGFEADFFPFSDVLWEEADPEGSAPIKTARRP